MDLSGRQIWRVWSAPATRGRGVARISAAEGLALLATSALVIATRAVMFTGAQRQLDTDFRLAAAELRRSTPQVESLAEAHGVRSAASLHREDDPSVPGTVMPPVLADGERQFDPAPRAT